MQFLLAGLAEAVDLEMMPGNGKALGRQLRGDGLQRTVLQRDHLVAIRADGVMAVLLGRQLI